MKTEDFIKEVNKLGFSVETSPRTLSIYYNNEIVVRVSRCKIFCADTTYASFYDLPKELREKLYNLVDEYARTPLEERKEPQRFYLKFAALTDNGDETYLNYYETDDSLGMFTRSQSFGFQTQFTQEEIDEIKEKFNVTLSDFEQIPIAEDEAV